MTRIPCLVCNKPYDGTTHCSVNACTACAMFFKRSLTWDGMPKCRTGKNDCRLDRAGKITCSSCRYRKCLEVGLNHKRNRRSLKRTVVQQGKVDLVEDIKMTIELPDLVVDAMPTMRRFCHFYALCTINKKNNEYAMLHADGAKLIELPGNRYMGKITQSLSDRMMPHDIAQFVKLMDGSFPAFTALDKSIQDTMLYRLMFPLFELSASFRSLRVFKDVNCRKILCTEALYADLNDLTGFIEPSMFSNPMDYKAIQDYMAVWWGKYLNTTHKTMHRINITDMEFLAVCALTIWDEDHFCHNDQLRLMAEKQRNLIYKDLDYYYKNILHLDNYVERIMNIKDLNKIIKHNYHILKESFHFLRTFNFYKSNAAMWDASSKVINAYESIGF